MAGRTRGMRHIRTADVVYKARLVAALQQPRTREELIKLAKMPSKNAFERVMRKIPHLTVGNRYPLYQLDDGKRAEL